MKKLFWSAIICVLILFLLAACSGNTNTPPTDSLSSLVTFSAEFTEPPSSKVPNESNETSTFIPSTDSPVVTEQSEMTPDTTMDSDTLYSANTSAPNISQPTQTEPPETGPPKTETTETIIPQSANIPVQNVSITYTSYSSENEPKPYLKGSAIYGILYNGERAQVGDSLALNLSVSPSNHKSKIVIETTENISYSISGNTITVRVNSIGDIATGRISVYATDTNGAILASKRFSFAIDNAGNPYDNLSSILSEYIRYLGMDYCTVTEGYTTNDPSLSFTDFAGAPAWDDQILKSNSTWLAQCFELLDKYKDAGFKKVNFIETATSLGFSASK